MRECLIDSSRENEKLKNDLQEVLADYHDNGKEPNQIAKEQQDDVISRTFHNAL